MSVPIICITGPILEVKSLPDMDVAMRNYNKSRSRLWLMTKEGATWMLRYHLQSRRAG